MMTSMIVNENGETIYSVNRAVINTTDDDTTFCNKIMKCSTVSGDTGFTLSLDDNGNGFIVFIPSSMSNPINNWVCQGIDNGLNVVLQGIK